MWHLMVDWRLKGKRELSYHRVMLPAWFHNDVMAGTMSYLGVVLAGGPPASSDLACM